MAKFCNNCGAPLEEGAKFCAGCGAAQQQGQPSAPQQPQQYADLQQQFAAQQQSQQYAAQQQSQQFAAQQPQQPQQQYAAPPQQPQAQQQYAAQQPPPQPQQQYAGPQQGGAVAVPKKKLSRKVLIVIIVAVAAVVLLLTVPRLAVDNNAEKDFFTIGGDNVPSVKNVLGEKRDITSLNSTRSGGVDEMVVKYSVNKDQGPEMEEYALALTDKYDFLSVNGFDFSGSRGQDFQFAKESDKSGYVVLVTLEYNTSGYTLELKRGAGTLTVQGGGAPGPTGPGPADPGPAGPEPVEPEPANPEPDDPGPADPEPDPDPGPVDEPEPALPDPPKPVPPTDPGPAADEIEIIVPDIIAGARTLEEAIARAPDGVTVVGQNPDGSITWRMSPETQQDLLYQCKQRAEQVFSIVLDGRTPGLEVINYNPETFETVYLTVTDVFWEDRNEQSTLNAIVNIAYECVKVPVLEGKGMQAKTDIGWGGPNFAATGQTVSPDILYRYLDW